MTLNEKIVLTAIISAILGMGMIGFGVFADNIIAFILGFGVVGIASLVSKRAIRAMESDLEGNT